MKRIIYGALIALFAFPLFLFADSPITSTDFWKAYQSEKIVKYAAENKELDKKVAKYLLKKKNPIEVKAAVINALSWNIEGTKIDLEFREFLAKKHKTTPENVENADLTGAELMCLGYCMVMSDYFHPGPSIPVLQSAANKLPNSFTAQMILALAESQAAFDTDWCRVYTVVEEVNSNQNLDREMNPEAIDIIMDYIVLYKGDCK